VSTEGVGCHATNRGGDGGLELCEHGLSSGRLEVGNREKSMTHLKDLPQGTIWPHLLESIERDVLEDIRSYASSRQNDVARGAESSELAALLVDKYCDGVAKALLIVGIDSQVRSEGDRLVRQIDPEFDAHRKARWAAKPAALALTA
jgi:hypothetical protein